jgi:hypothetical protein
MNVVQPEEKNVPRILLEFLLYGVEDDKPLVSKALDELQKQQDNSRVARKRMRILWYMDKGEKTPDEKKQWLIENAKCKYYRFLEPPYDVPKNFVKECMQKIRVCENAVKSMKASGIQVAKPEKKEETYAEVIED